MNNPEERETMERTWRFYIDHYSESYEITNTSRERAEVGDGFLWGFADKDCVHEALAYLNALEARAGKAEGLYRALKALDACHYFEDTVRTEDWGLYTDAAIPEVRAAYVQAYQAIAEYERGGNDERIQAG